MISRQFACALVVFASAVSAFHGYAQSDTTITYQGVLNASGQPYTGSADFDFSLWDDPVAGIQLGSNAILDNVTVEDGHFVVYLDFGVQSYSDASRWLQIGVSTPHNPDMRPDYDIMSPRQPVSRSPYSIQTRGLFVDQSKNVGIGTNEPQYNVDIHAETPVLNMTASDPNPSSFPTFRFTGADGPSIFQPLGAIAYYDDQGNRRASIETRQSGSSGSSFSFYTSDSLTSRLSVFDTGPRAFDQLELYRSSDNSIAASIGSDGNNSFFQLQGGNLGIGTSTPEHLTHILGSRTLPVLRTHNQSSGPALQASGGSDITSNSGGTIIVGDTSANNIAIDGNEIMARNDGSTSTLLLNEQGGDVRFGQYQTVPIYAYGKVSSSGSLGSAASSNVLSCSRTGVGTYEVNIAGLNWPHAMLIATINQYPAGGTIQSFNNGPGGFTIHTGEWQTQTAADAAFSFVVINP